MKREEVHALWAPDGDTWRSWVKPVLFAALPAEVTPSDVRHAPREIGDDPDHHARHLVDALEAGRPVGYRGRPGGDAAVVIDLAGEDSVNMGVALAQLGFRPVPIFNALPAPGDQAGVCDLRHMMEALVDGARLLRDVSAGGPPCFLLDRGRMAEGSSRPGGIFDNRSICRVVDFPSADALRAAGIRRFVVFNVRPMQNDLATVLLGWQSAGIPGHRFHDTKIRPITVRGPSLLRRVADFFRYDGLGARPDGSFGKTIPQGG